MARVCMLCGKGSVAGHNIQHHSKKSKWRYKAPRTNRSFRPNLQWVWLNVDGQQKRMHVCMKCYKKARQDETVA